MPEEWLKILLDGAFVLARDDNWPGQSPEFTGRLIRLVKAFDRRFPAFWSMNASFLANRLCRQYPNLANFIAEYESNEIAQAIRSIAMPAENWPTLG